MPRNAVKAAIKPGLLVGNAEPRVGPPTPARSLFKEWEQTSRDLHINPLPWQSYLARVSYATKPGGEWLYPEVAALVSRQNGKTTFLQPHIVTRLRAGRRLLHAAQNRDLPRQTFLRLSTTIESLFPDAKVRRGQGQESLEIPSTGGEYRITAATSGGPRGWSVDDLLVDELREIGEDFIQGAIPTMTASLNAQTLYLSNAGEDSSAALNAVRRRADDDPALAYMEWSAAPGLAADDREAWKQANPALGHFPRLEETLERLYRSAKLAGTLAHFETEQLCRWVSSMRSPLVDPAQWALARRDELTKPVRPAIGVSMSPDGNRASVALAWLHAEGKVSVRLLADMREGDNPHPDAVGEQLRTFVKQYGVREVGFDPLTDRLLTKYVKKSVPISGQHFANASAFFANMVTVNSLHHTDSGSITDDLTWTSRQTNTETGSYEAVRARDEYPITAALASIRAVWLAGGPRPATARVL